MMFRWISVVPPAMAIPTVATYDFEKRPAQLRPRAFTPEPAVQAHDADADARLTLHVVRGEHLDDADS